VDELLSSDAGGPVRLELIVNQRQVALRVVASEGPAEENARAVEAVAGRWEAWMFPEGTQIVTPTGRTGVRTRERRLVAPTGGHLDVSPAMTTAACRWAVAAWQAVLDTRRSTGSGGREDLNPR
jgi:hypothetical protein